MWSSVYSYIPLTIKKYPKITSKYGTDLSRANISMKPTCYNKLIMHIIITFITGLQTSFNFESLLRGKKDDMEVMSAALKGSMHKPLASCMWIF